MSINNVASVSPNPYLLAFATAALAGAFAVFGGYYAAKFQGREAFIQKQLEFRVKAYESFLESDRKRSPSLSRLLTLGSMADRLTTDAEIQAFESQASALFKKVEVQDLHSQLSSECSLLRLHGSSRVVTICEDLISAWLARDEEIQWGKYTSDTQAFRERWRPSELQLKEYGYELKLSDADRWRILSFSKLRAALFEQLRTEIQLPPA